MATNKFWSDASLEPKRMHRWLLYIGGEPIPGSTSGTVGIPTYVVKKVDKPKFTVNETPHSFFGHKFYYPGNVEWQDMSFTLVDPIDPDVSKKLYDALISGGYAGPESQPVSTVSKNRLVSAFGNIITLQQLDPNNTVLDQFQLINPWVKNVEFGSLDYESDALVEISVTVRYDWANFSLLGG
tara:strand:- start:1206 stop:1754 length:549 start_codon:yes stop_codon:yes gene_type:complete